MKVALVGCKVFDMVVKGEKVQGVKLFFNYKTPDTQGLCTGDVYISKEDETEICLVDPVAFVGNDIEMEFDRKGRLVSLCALPD